MLAMVVMMLGVAIACGLAAAGLAWWLAFGLLAITYGGGGGGGWSNWRPTGGGAWRAAPAQPCRRSAAWWMVSVPRR